MIGGEQVDFQAQHSQKTDHVVLFCLVWSVLKQKVEGVAGSPEISHKGSNTKRTGDFFIPVHGTADTYQEEEMLDLYILYPV